MKRKRKVAHIVTTLDMGGAQLTVAEIVTRLDTAQFTPLIVTGSDKVSGDIHERLESAGIPVFRVKSLRRSPALSELRALSEIHRILRNERVDIVHTHSSKAGVLGRIAARFSPSRPAIVHTVHGWSFRDSYRRSARFAAMAVERILARMTDVLVVVTSVDRAIGLKHKIGSAGQYRLVRSGISFDNQLGGSEVGIASRIILGLPEHARLVGWIGRFSPLKDPETLLKVSSEIVGEETSVEVVLIGTGPLEVDTRRLASRLPGSERIRFLGLRDDVPDLLRHLDVVLLTSKSEGLPRSVVEAAAEGIPIVTTDVGGVREVIVDGHNGFVVPVGDVIKLVDGVKRCLAGEIMPGPSELEAIREEFSAAKMVRLTEEVYNGIRPGI